MAYSNTTLKIEGLLLPALPVLALVRVELDPAEVAHLQQGTGRLWVWAGGEVVIKAEGGCWWVGEG